MAEYPPPKEPRGTEFNPNDYLYLYQPLKYITNIGTGSKVYKQTNEGTAELRTIKSSHMTITQGTNEIDVASDGLFRAVNGTNTNVAYGFSSAVNTGMHRNTSGDLHFIRAGSDVFQFQNNQIVIPNNDLIFSGCRWISNQPGTASNPSYVGYDGKSNNQGIFYKATTWEPSIAFGGNLIAEFGNSIVYNRKYTSTVQPYSSYLRNANQTPIGGLTTLLYDTKEQEFSSDITFASGVYTVVNAGVYLVHADLQISNAASFDLSAFFTVNNVATDRIGYVVSRASTVHLVSISNVVYLAAGANIRAQVICAASSTFEVSSNGIRRPRFSIVRLF